MLHSFNDMDFITQHVPFILNKNYCVIRPRHQTILVFHATWLLSSSAKNVSKVYLSLDDAIPLGEEKRERKCFCDLLPPQSKMKKLIGEAIHTTAFKASLDLYQISNLFWASKPMFQVAYAKKKYVVVLLKVNY